MSYTILLLTLPSITAELLALIFPERVLALFSSKPGERVPADPFGKLLAVLSICYAANLLLLLISGDTIFQLSVLMVISLGISLWSFKQWVIKMKPVMMMESTLCLVILVNVVITILRMNRIVRL